MTTLLLDAVYIALADPKRTPRVFNTHAQTVAAMLGTALRFLKQVWAQAVLPYAAIVEATRVGRIGGGTDLIPPDPFSTESGFVRPLWPREPAF